MRFTKSINKIQKTNEVQFICIPILKVPVAREFIKPEDVSEYIPTFA